MSNSTDKTGCISHRQNTRFFIMYEDYLEVGAKVSYGHRHKLAAFWRVLETKTNDRMTYNEEAEKQGHAKLDLWVEISYSECVSRSLETFKSSSFQVAAAESERLGFSKSRARKRRINPLDPQSPLEDYKEYLFLSNAMQSVINGGTYPTPIEINSPLLKSLSQRKEERKQQRAIKNNTPPIEINSPPIENNTSPLLNSTPGAIKNNRKKYREGSLKDNKDNKERESPPNTLDSTAIVSSDTAHADSLQDEEMFRNDEPQGDIHATAASGHPHRVGEPATTDVDNHHGIEQSRRLATPEARPVLETQEIDEKGQTDGNSHQRETLTETPTTPTPAQSLPLPQAEQVALGTRTRTRKAATAPDKPEFLPEGEALYRDWCSLFHVTIPKTKAIILAANELYEPITFWAEQKLGITKAEVLKRIMNWLYKNNPNYYGEGRGVKLYDIHRDFEEWQSAAERKLAKDALKVVVPPAEDKSRMFNMTPIILESSRTKRQGGLRGKAVTATH